MKKIIGIGLMLALFIPVIAEIKITKCDFFAPYFKNPYEAYVFVFDDDIAYKFTSEDEIRVEIQAQQIEAIFKAWKRNISDLILIIHNHPTPGGWSSGDKDFILGLRDRGYDGPAFLFMPGGNIKVADF